MTRFNDRSDCNLNRRDVLKRAGAAGIAFAGAPTVVSAGELTDTELLEILEDPKVQAIEDAMGTFVVESTESATVEGEIDGTTHTITVSELETDLGLLKHVGVDDVAILPTMVVDIENNPSLEDVLPDDLLDRPDDTAVLVRGVEEGEVIFARTVSEDEWTDLDEFLDHELRRAFYASGIDGYRVMVDEASADDEFDMEIYHVDAAMTQSNDPTDLDWVWNCIAMLNACAFCIIGMCNCPCKPWESWYQIRCWVAYPVDHLTNCADCLWNCSFCAFLCDDAYECLDEVL